jgi:4-amino-4-deoxy-L-arabinose transferase
MSIPLLVFFVVKSRLFFYVLPLYPPVALAMARWISLKEKPGARIGRTVAIAAAMAAILIAAKGAGLFYSSSKDMKAAYQLCRKVEKERPVFVVVNEERYFGLQFYLDGALKRVSIGHKHTPAPGEDSFWDGTLQASLEAIRKDVSQRPYAYLVVEKRADALVEQLKRAGLPFEQYKGKFWSLCFVRGKSGETPARPARPEAR